MTFTWQAICDWFENCPDASAEFAAAIAAAGLSVFQCEDLQGCPIFNVSGNSGTGVVSGGGTIVFTTDPTISEVTVSTLPTGQVLVRIPVIQDHFCGSTPPAAAAIAADPFGRPQTYIQNITNCGIAKQVTWHNCAGDGAGGTWIPDDLVSHATSTNQLATTPVPTGFAYTVIAAPMAATFGDNADYHTSNLLKTICEKGVHRIAVHIRYTDPFSVGQADLGVFINGSVTQLDREVANVNVNGSTHLDGYIERYFAAVTTIEFVTRHTSTAAQAAEVERWSITRAGRYQ